MCIIEVSVYCVHVRRSQITQMDVDVLEVEDSVRLLINVTTRKIR